MRTRTALLFSLGFALLVGFTLTGHVLYRSFIGLDPSAFPGGETIQALALRWNPDLHTTAAGGALAATTLLFAGVVAFVAVRRARVESVDPSRRRFLTGAGSGVGAALGGMLVAGAAGAGRALFGLGEGNRGWADMASKIMDRQVAFTNPEWKESWKGARIQAHRRFGRTEWQVSDIVLGTGRISGENGERIARLALERGVNYFDTSPDYSGAGSEEAMGRAIRGVRDRLFIATKFCTPTGHLPPGAPVSRYMEVVEGSLRRLGTDYVDLCHIHSCDEVARLMDPNAHEAFDRLKQQGKVRFLGFSTHTPNLVEVANRAIDSGRFDVMMLAYHHGIWPALPDVIRRARRAQDMGVVAMKTLKGAKYRGLEHFQPYADSYAQAALRWVLSNPDVSCAVISFFELQHVDEYLSASGRPFTQKDLAVLEEYDRQIAGSYCAPHCGRCLSSCPEGLPIHDVLRYRMYFEDYGWEKEGMRLYSQLSRRADVCANCPAPCTGTCPQDIPIRERMLGANELLTLG
jgi:aryl-alcohol dehydrogenase-like predicted oxidoreductase